MSTGIPIVASRLQNRRGTQSEFDSLYPGEYTSAPGATSAANVVTVSDTTGLAPNRPVFVTAGVGKFADGTVVSSVNSGTTFTVSINPVIPLSSGSTIIFSPKYNGIGGATGPDILQLGEIGLCTDTRKVFIGNLNGEYVDLTAVISPADIVTIPFMIELPPSPGAFTAIVQLTQLPTPYLSFLYSLVDVSTNNPNEVGVTFSRNGELSITAIIAPTIQPPLPVTLTDTSTEINITPNVVDVNPPYNAVQPDISFRADYDTLGNIQISYTHNFTGSLTFSTSYVIWAPF